MTAIDQRGERRAGAHAAEHLPNALRHVRLRGARHAGRWRRAWGSGRAPVAGAGDRARAHDASSAVPPKTTRKRDPGTRPTDLRRYLKPLLKVREDLLLIDRRLVIRPVRHLLRGVSFNRAGHPSGFYLRRTIRPLYISRAWSGVGNWFGVTQWRVHEPYFQALLEAELAQDGLSAWGGHDAQRVWSLP